MRMTTKGRYAVTAMLDLALHEDEGPISLAEISSRQDISLSYLEQLFSRMRKKSLVDSSRGPGGGYRLSKAKNEISIADVITAVDEQVDSTNCGGQKNCQGDESCLTHDLWVELSDQIYLFLNGITIDDLVQRKGIKDVSERQDLKIIETGMLRKGIVQ